MPRVSQRPAPPSWETLVLESVGRVIEYWGFKRNHGRLWALLYIMDAPMNAADLGRRVRFWPQLQRGQQVLIGRRRVALVVEEDESGEGVDLGQVDIAKRAFHAQTLRLHRLQIRLVDVQ